MVWYEAPLYIQREEGEVVSVTPGYLKYGELTAFTKGVAYADWYDYKNSTVLVQLHFGSHAPSGWTMLDRKTFLAMAEKIGKPSLAVAEAAWPKE